MTTGRERDYNEIQRLTRGAARLTTENAALRGLMLDLIVFGSAAIDQDEDNENRENAAAVLEAAIKNARAFLGLAEGGVTMKYTDEQLDQLEAVARAATPGPWSWGCTPTKTLNAAVRWVSKMIRRSDQPGLWEVYAGSPDEPRVTALVGNGPDAEANAAYIVSVQPETVLNLVRETRRWRGGRTNND